MTFGQFGSFQTQNLSCGTQLLEVCHHGGIEFRHIEMPLVPSPCARAALSLFLTQEWGTGSLGISLISLIVRVVFCHQGHYGGVSCAPNRVTTWESVVQLKNSEQCNSESSV